MGPRILTTPDGMTVRIEFGADPRFGLSVPMASKIVITHSRRPDDDAHDHAHRAPLSPLDPFSFTQMTETENTDGAISTLTYTKATRTFSAISAGNRRETATLDAKARPISVTEGSGRTPSVITYDAKGRPTGMTQGTLGHTYTWDGRDRLATSADGAGRHQSYAYDGDDRTTAVTDGVGGVAHFAYDGEDALTRVTEPSGAVHALGVDGFGDLTGYTPPGGAAQSISRDAEGKVSGQNQGAGHQLTIGRDAGGRLTAINATGDDVGDQLRRRHGPPGDDQLEQGRHGTGPGSGDRVGFRPADQAHLQRRGRRESSPSDTTRTGTSPAAACRAAATTSLRRSPTTRTTCGRARGRTTSPAAARMGELTRVDDGTVRQDFTYDGLGRQATLAGSVGGTARFGETLAYDAGDKVSRRDRDLRNHHDEARLLLRRCRPADRGAAGRQRLGELRLRRRTATGRAAPVPGSRARRPRPMTRRGGWRAGEGSRTRSTPRAT